MFGVIGAVGTFICGEYLYYRVLPVYQHFEYHSIELGKPAIIGEPIEFVSTREIRRTSSIEWLDTLFCDLGDGIGFRHFSQKDTSRDSIPASGGIVKQPWTYTARTPHVDATCYLLSVSTGIFPYGIQKTHRTVVTEKFDVRHR
ncbi:MAG: hypothetical protein GY927_04770 [bacterium]|nr:hypothetical protein [bacterium]